jgi:hypothetical protein
MDLGTLKDFPTLKNIMLFTDTKAKGMLNYKDLFTIYNDEHIKELNKREAEIDFEAPTNI